MNNIYMTLTCYVEEQVTRLVQNYITAYMKISDISCLTRTRMCLVSLYEPWAIDSPPLDLYSHAKIDAFARKG